MKIALLSSILIFAVNFVRAQLNRQQVAESSVVEHSCGQDQRWQQLTSNPANASFLIGDMAAQEQSLQQLRQNPHRTVYRIPVVFHVMYWSQDYANISREQIMDALRILNQDYRLQNADTSYADPLFQDIIADAEIEFVLATIAPDGNCFSGITRTHSPSAINGDSLDVQLAAIKAGNDVFNGEWPGDKYLNIFVSENISGYASLTSQPNSFPEIGSTMANGVWMLHSYVGSIGTSSVSTSRFLTHEVGHWLNLLHMWALPTGSGDCGDDEVDDTPICDPTPGCTQGLSECGTYANVNNFMGYIFCGCMFTTGQVERMHAALNSTVGGRNNIWTAQNHAETGIDEDPVICHADFSPGPLTICEGMTIDFEDESYNLATSWNWSFPGGTPATSSAQNPSVTYATAGVYPVTLTASDGSNSNTESRAGYVTVLPLVGEPLPFVEGFEGLTDFVGSTRWAISNEPSNNAWEITNTAAHTGTKSAMLSNFGEPDMNVDELISNTIDLSNITETTGVTMSFRYAYRKRELADDDYLKVFIASNCGENWLQKKTLHGTTLSPFIETDPWTPADSQWTTVHMTNILESSWVSNFRLKFRFESAGGNNVFLDDINIYAGEPSDSIIVGLTSSENLFAVSLYPNPADEEINVRFSSADSQDVKLEVVDLTGQVVMRQVVKAAIGNNLVLLSTATLAPGSYLIRIGGSETPTTLPVVIR